MKKLLLILIALPLIGFGQTWTFKDGGNAFDGKYKTAFIRGDGQEFPYNNPILCVNKFESQDKVNFYIGDAGYFDSDYSSAIVYFSFSNEEGVIYVSKNHNYSNDGSNIHLWDFMLKSNNSVEFKKKDIIKKLTDAKYVDIRISTQSSKNDLRFSLNGSTKAIKFVIPE